MPQKYYHGYLYIELILPEGGDSFRKNFLKFICEYFRYNSIRDIVKTSRPMVVYFVPVRSFRNRGNIRPI